MTPGALIFLTALGEFGGVALNSFSLWGAMAAGIATSTGAGWAVDTAGAYRMTQAGEAALYAELTA